MTTTERCGTTELLVSDCGCKQHRGGQTVDEQVLAHRAELLASGWWIAARFPGTCNACGTSFGTGTAIQRDTSAITRFRAECCS